jgi:hypothetical protein
MAWTTKIKLSTGPAVLRIGEALVVIEAREAGSVRVRVECPDGVRLQRVKERKSSLDNLAFIDRPVAVLPPDATPALRRFAGRLAQALEGEDAPAVVHVAGHRDGPVKLRRAPPTDLVQCPRCADTPRAVRREGRDGFTRRAVPGCALCGGVGELPDDDIPF